jgi:hypothetical protein
MMLPSLSRPTASTRRWPAGGEDSAPRSGGVQRFRPMIRLERPEVSGRPQIWVWNTRPRCYGSTGIEPVESVIASVAVK